MEPAQSLFGRRASVLCYTHHVCPCSAVCMASDVSTWESKSKTGITKKQENVFSHMTVLQKDNKIAIGCSFPETSVV